MFVEGFFTALGALAAIAAVVAGSSIILGIPSYLYFRKQYVIFKEMFRVIQKYNDNPEDFLNLKQGVAQ